MRLNWILEKLLGKTCLMIKKLGRNGEVVVIKARKISQETMNLKNIVNDQALIGQFDQDEQKWLSVLAAKYAKNI
tara:strand:+ start:666 stop:890 length:225 start_codon:yes stop_codon:yes gene_type:complete